jgi:hypothetical protein
VKRSSFKRACGYWPFLACLEFSIGLSTPSVQASEPLLIIGKSDARLRGAFSTGFLESPFDTPEKGGEIWLDINLPVNVSASVQQAFSDADDSTVVMPEFLTGISQLMNAQVKVAAPLWGGTFVFAARENAGLVVDGAMGDVSFQFDTTMASGGFIKLKGGVHLPVHTEIRWRSLSFGYAYAPLSWMRLGFQVHKHMVDARMSGDLEPDVSGRIGVGDDGGTTFAVDYPPSKVYGTASGIYGGGAWSPEMGIKVGPVRYVARMGTRLKAKGHLDFEWQVPFFIDPESFDMKISEPDSFLTTDNLRRLLGGETEGRQYRFRDPVELRLPTTHQFAWDFLSNRMRLSYTRVIGSVSSSAHAEPQVERDSTDLDLDGVLNAGLWPDHMLLVSGDFQRWRFTLGAFAANLHYDDESNRLSGLFPLEIDGDPVVPVFQFGLIWGSPIHISIDTDIFPIPAVRVGVRYGF